MEVSHNRVPTRMEDDTKQKIYIALTREKTTLDVYVENQTKVGKNHGSSQTPNCPLCDGRYNKRLGGNNLTLYLFAKRQLQQRHHCVYLSLSLSLILSRFVHTHSVYKIIIITNCVCPSYIYTNITIRLFTNIASKAHRNIFTNMSLLLVHTGSIWSGFRLMACPVPIQRD